MLKLLIAGNNFFTNGEIEDIKKIGYNITIVEREDCSDIPNIEQYDVVVCNWLFVRHDIHLFQNLKAVQLMSAGLDRIPLDYIEQHHIRIGNARGVYSIPIAEFTLMTVLDAYKHSEFFYNNQNDCKWEKCRELDELSDKTVCVFGTGSVGTEVAKKFSVFAKRVVGVDLFPKDTLYFNEVVGLSQKDVVVEESDVVVLTLPLTKDTYHMFNAELLSKMKETAILVNVARGALIDEVALKQALDNGKFKSVILDVFEHEPLDESFWGWKSGRMRIIPHNTFASKNNAVRMKKQIMDNLSKWAFEFYE